jgi:hypothetical protein
MQSAENAECRMQSADNAECRGQRLQNAVYFEHHAASIIRLRLRQYADVWQSSTQPSLHALLLCVDTIEDRQWMQLRMYTSSFDDNVTITSEKGITIVKNLKSGHNGTHHALAPASPMDVSQVRIVSTPPLDVVHVHWYIGGPPPTPAPPAVSTLSAPRVLDAREVQRTC